MTKFRHWIAKAMYRLTWPIWHFIFKFFLHYKIKYEDKTAVLEVSEGPVILTSNHVAWFDPFMVGTPLHKSPKIFPIRWLTKEGLFKRPFVGQGIWLYGSIKLKRGLGLENTLQEAINILKSRGTIGIFPQGRVWKGGRPRKGRPGAAYLAIHTDPLIIPIHIKGIHKITFKDFILRRKNVSITIGAPFKLPSELMHNPVRLKEAADYIWSRVRELK